jgi:hypothetical protein
MYDWVRNPFVGLAKFTKYEKEEEQCTELHCSHTLIVKFNEVQLVVFWISLRKEYPVISAKAVKIVLQFSSSYLCEQAFSCECVCQKLDQEFNICAKRNKLKYHIKSKLYDDFGCQVYFDV